MIGALAAGDLALLELVATLRLAPPHLLLCLGGQGGRTRVYGLVARLRAAGLVDAARLSSKAGRAPDLLRLTDSGAAVLAGAACEEPRAHERRRGLDWPALRALALRLPQHLGCCDLLGYLSRSRPGPPRLLGWSAPARLPFPRRRGRDGLVRLPAAVELAWADETAAYLLLPDDPHLPLDAYRATLVGLARRRLAGLSVPLLLISTPDERRADAWRDLLEEAARAGRDAPLPAVIAVDLGRPAEWSPPPAERGPSTAPPRAVRPPGGDPFDPRPRPRSDAHRTGVLALGLLPGDRRLLDVIGGHPWMVPRRIALALGWGERWARQRLEGLLARGLARLDGGARATSERRPILTRAGLAVAAAWHGLTIGQAARFLGYAAFDPAAQGGRRWLHERRREELARIQAHTIGTDEVFTDLVEALLDRRAVDPTAALTVWRNAAQCARGHFRPDGYGLVRLDGRHQGFLLEYDRATMKPIQMQLKFERYYLYRDEGTFRRDYDGFPLVLVVTTEARAMQKIGAILSRLAFGRDPLPVLLTATGWAADNGESYLGSVWYHPIDAAELYLEDSSHPRPDVACRAFPAGPRRPDGGAA